MKRLFKCIAVLLVLSVIGLYCPNVSFGAGSGLFAKTDQKPITRHEPKIMSEPAKEITGAAAKTAAKKKTPWLKIGLGAAALAVLAALAAGGGGGGNGSEPKTGDITVQW